MLIIFGLVFFCHGCSTAYYAMWEKLGKEKRHLLKDNVEEVRNQQEKATDEFQSVLERVRKVYGYEGGELESFYDELKSDYEDCRTRAENISERIRTVEEVAQDLFSEWEVELSRMENQRLKSESRRALSDTKLRYNRLHRAMVKAEQGMHPVLKNLEDYVLYLKHNLNARAVGALKQEAKQIQLEVNSLIQDIKASVEEADDFVNAMEEN